ncbi:unnamed protein product [Alternaria alternata]
MPTRKQAAPPSSSSSSAEEKETCPIVTPQSSPQKLLLHESARLNKITEINAVRSPLLRLPAEIKAMIYTYVFDEFVLINKYPWFLNYHVSLRPRQFSDYDRYPSSAYCEHNFLSLLHVSRQIHQETALLPYKLATFYFDTLPPEELEDDEDNMFSAIRVFLEKRTRKQVEALAKLEINILDDDVSGIGELESGTDPKRLLHRSTLSCVHLRLTLIAALALCVYIRTSTSIPPLKNFIPSIMASRSHTPLYAGNRQLTDKKKWDDRVQIANRDKAYIPTSKAAGHRVMHNQSRRDQV